MVGQKGMLSEGGIRVPFVGAWPGTWPAGTVYDTPVINLDAAATAVAAAGLPPDPALDGVDLTPFVTGRDTAAPHKMLFWRWITQAAVLEMPYKLIRLDGQPPMLFDVTTPDGENAGRDLAAQNPEIVTRLGEALENWAKELKPPGLDAFAGERSRFHEKLFADHDLLPRKEAGETKAGGDE